MWVYASVGATYFFIFFTNHSKFKWLWVYYWWWWWCFRALAVSVDYSQITVHARGTGGSRNVCIVFMKGLLEVCECADVLMYCVCLSDMSDAGGKGAFQIATGDKCNCIMDWMCSYKKNGLAQFLLLLINHLHVCWSKLSV